MRLAAQTKLGFYPAAPTAVDGILSHLRMPVDPAKRAEVRILDPCAGEGLAVKQLASGLGIPSERIYAIELDAGRADATRAILGEGANVLGPASFMGCRVGAQSFGMVYCNPPFDDEMGGGKRQELTFAQMSTTTLKAGSGILVLVMPFTAIEGNIDFQTFLDANYQDAALYEFPPAVRKFKEVVYIGKRRKVDAPPEYRSFLRSLVGWRLRDTLPVIGTDGKLWALPNTWAPHTFIKREMTEGEMVEAVESSPLMSRLAPPLAREKARPPLPLYKGHVALLLASGLLDGPVYPDGEPPHVVRGTARKITYLADRSETENPDTGAVTEKETWSQKIELSVRAVGEDGDIKTFEGQKEDEPEPDKKGKK